MTTNGRTESLEVDRRHPTHSIHLEYLGADIAGIACVVRKLT